MINEVENPFRRPWF